MRLDGVCLDNVNEPPDGSYEKLWLFGAQVVGTLWTNGTRHKRGVYDKLERLSRPFYSVRVGPSGRVDTTTWIQDLKDAASEIPPDAFIENRIHFRCMNEWNHPVEGAWSPKDYAKFMQKCYQDTSDLRKQWNRVPLICSPVSLGFPDWEEKWDEFVGLGALEYCDGIGVNAYAHLVDTAIAKFEKYQLPLHLTEINHANLRGTQRIDWLINRLNSLGPQWRTTQVFIVGGQSFGGWDENYVLSKGEAKEFGWRRPELHAHQTQPTPELRNGDLTPEWYETKAWWFINQGLQALAGTGVPIDQYRAEQLSDVLNASKADHST